MDLQYALSLPNGGECGHPRILADLAALAEASGWDGLFLEDYICYTNDTYHSIPGNPTYDPWVALAAVALSTSRIRLGTLVTPLPRRRPWKLAREAVTLDHLSNGRLILGVGSGDVRDPGYIRVGESSTAGARQRAEMLDESLQILAGLWSGQPFSYTGKHYSIEDVTFLPAPVQSPRIPVWVGGGWPNPGPTERAARWDGSCLYRQTTDGSWQDMTPDDVRSLRAFVESRRTSGTDASPFAIVVGGRQRSSDPEQDRALIRSLAEVGATWWSEWVPAADLPTMRAAIARGPLRV
jgi:alkanesulfonate monooxygenase SsuD/methylene tetrahydromethanopterin reductase-like flavin-dependent oxidoreductase (luciferase family)